MSCSTMTGVPALGSKRTIGVFLNLHRKFSGTNPENSESRPRRKSQEELRQLRDELRDRREAAAREHRRGNPAIIVGIVEAVLKDERRPMTRGELASAIEDRGVELPGADKPEKARYVGTILWRNGEKFENHEGKGYWFKDQPVPDGTGWLALADKAD